MTQVKSAQTKPKEVALRKRAGDRTLAQRRAAFVAQVRDMALSDLSQVSARLKTLHKELEELEGRRWTHYELASAMKIAPRTFQSWENGEVENTSGKGYDKLARWYSRKLGRKITRQWIVFGESAESIGAAPDLLDALTRRQSGRGEAEDDLPSLEDLPDDAVELLQRILQELLFLQIEVASIPSHLQAIAEIVQPIGIELQAFREEVG